MQSAEQFFLELVAPKTLTMITMEIRIFTGHKLGVQELRAAHAHYDSKVSCATPTGFSYYTVNYHTMYAHQKCPASESKEKVPVQKVVQSLQRHN
jgi:hypothetical protein